MCLFDSLCMCLWSVVHLFKVKPLHAHTWFCKWLNSNVCIVCYISSRSSMFVYNPWCLTIELTLLSTLNTKLVASCFCCTCVYVPVYKAWPCLAGYTCILRASCYGNWLRCMSNVQSSVKCIVFTVSHVCHNM